MSVTSIMDNFFVLMLLGFIIGTCGTLIGAGGGFLLVPLLLITHKQMQPNTVTAISIAVVAANAISGSVAYARSGRIDYKAGLLFGVFTIPGSIIGVFLVNYIPRHLFNIVFGVLLLLLALFLFINNKEAGTAGKKMKDGKVHQHRELTDANGEKFSYSYNPVIGIVISIFVGFLSPMLGIGGGIIHVPAMVQWLQFPVYIATATSHFILAIMSMVSVVVHIFQGSYNDANVLKMIAGLCIGVVPGAQLGAYISHRVQTTLIIRVLAICLAMVGLRILL